MLTWHLTIRIRAILSQVSIRPRAVNTPAVAPRMEEGVESQEGHQTAVPWHLEEPLLLLEKDLQEQKCQNRCKLHRLEKM